ncbi:Vacuolar-sorting receptor 6 [Platanthera zijinensis]|uniref:Vacuolar-sorting receptor 6 n=1 Tax=Platanthera zijinensis TaxID=2320716 RepID=A0AAP0AZI2_9ASPA
MLNSENAITSSSHVVGHVTEFPKKPFTALRSPLFHRCFDTYTSSSPESTVSTVSSGFSQIALSPLRPAMLCHLCAAALFLSSVTGRFIVERSSIRVLWPVCIKGRHESAIANFRIPNYGGTLRGVVLYPEKGSNGCSPFDGSTRKLCSTRRTLITEFRPASEPSPRPRSPCVDKCHLMEFPVIKVLEGYEGMDVVVKNLRQLCVHRVANESSKSWIWWDYVTDSHVRCSMKEKKYSQECADDVIKSLVCMPLGKVQECMGDSEADVENPVLMKEQEVEVHFSS